MLRRSAAASWPAASGGKAPRRGVFQTIAVVAPAGYGKTTLLAQWAERKHATVAWVSLDDRDNDPAVLLTYLAVALDRVERDRTRRVFGPWRRSGARRCRRGSAGCLDRGNGGAGRRSCSITSKRSPILSAAT